MQIQTPDWVKNAIFYQIFPDRFARSKQPRRRLLQNFLWEQWHEIPTLKGYKGGDLWGIIEQLDYLQDLGINAINFTPIFQSASNHRYHRIRRKNPEFVRIISLENTAYSAKFTSKSRYSTAAFSCRRRPS
jgi:hypothetical protein